MRVPAFLNGLKPAVKRFRDRARSAYVALSAGISMQMVAVGYWVIKFCGFKSWAKPLQIAGINALAFYVFSGVVQKILIYGRIPGEDCVPVRLRYAIYEQFVPLWIPGKLGALVFASTYLFICFVFAVILFRKKDFINL